MKSAKKPMGCWQYDAAYRDRPQVKKAQIALYSGFCYNTNMKRLDILTQPVTKYRLQKNVIFLLDARKIHRPLLAGGNG